MEMGNGVNQYRLFDNPCGYGLLLDRGVSACNFIIYPTLRIFGGQETWSHSGVEKGGIRSSFWINI